MDVQQNERQPKKGKPKSRGNGQGTIYKYKNTWRLVITLGYEKVPQPDGTYILKPHRKKKFGFKTRKEAQDYIPILRKNEQAVKLISFSDIYDEWNEFYSPKIGRSTQDCYRAAKKYFEPIFFYTFKSITIEDLQSCIDECPKGKRTRENMKALAGLMYKYAIPRKQTDGINLAEYLVVGKEESGTYPAFTKEQVKTIYKGAKSGVPHAEDILCMIFTGFRPAELLSLKKDDYIVTDDCAYLVGGIKTEAGKGRAVTIAPNISDIIQKRYESSSPFLFPRDDGKQMTVDYFRDNYFYKCLSDLGIQHVPTKENPAEYVPYSCRHTFSNMLKNAAGADKDKAALIGHEDYTTTKRMYQSAELLNLKRITDQFGWEQ